MKKTEGGGVFLSFFPVNHDLIHLTRLSNKHPRSMSKSEPSGISAEGRQRNNLQSVCSIFLSSSPIRRNRKKRNERKGGTTKMVAAQQEEGGSRGRDSVLSCTRKSTGIGLDQFRRLGSLESSGALEKKRRNTGRRE